MLPESANPLREILEVAFEGGSVRPAKRRRRKPPALPSQSFSPAQVRLCTIPALRAPPAHLAYGRPVSGQYLSDKAAQLKQELSLQEPPVEHCLDIRVFHVDASAELDASAKVSLVEAFRHMQDIGQLNGILPHHKELEVFTIAEGDRSRPELLWNAKGLRTRKRIQQDTVIGSYTAWVGFEDEYEERFCEPHPLHEFVYNMYAMEFSDWNCIARSRWKHAESGQRLLCCAYSVEQPTTFINDPKFDVFVQESDARDRVPNVVPQEVIVSGWPYILFRTAKDIEAGEELLMRYHDYPWESFKHSMIRLHREIEASRSNRERLLDWATANGLDVDT